MDTSENRKKLIQFLNTISRPDMPADELDHDDGLVKSGLIDSLAMLEIISFLESEFTIDFSETGIDPVDLESINAILALIERRCG